MYQDPIESAEIKKCSIQFQTLAFNSEQYLPIYRVLYVFIQLYETVRMHAHTCMIKDGIQPNKTPKHSLNSLKSTGANQSVNLYPGLGPVICNSNHRIRADGGHVCPNQAQALIGLVFLIELIGEHDGRKSLGGQGWLWLRCEINNDFG